MCGKFTQMMSWREVHEYSDFMRAKPNDGTANAPEQHSEGYAVDDPRDGIETVTPMRLASIIRLNDAGAREVKRMRWGFARATAQSPSARPDHIHARAETLDSKPTFREAFEMRRGILVVRTFNEGKEITPRKTEQHRITPRDGKPLGIAVLWECWTHDTEGEFFTFVMVTVPANTLIGKITDRMPAVLRPDEWSKWLGEIPASPDELKALLTPFEGDWDMDVETKSVKRPKPSPPDSSPGLF